MGPPFCSCLPDSSIQQDGCILASEGAVVFIILTSEGTKVVLTQPTSLNRGERLVTGMMGEVGGVEGEGKGEVSGWEVVVAEGENDQKSTMMQLMAVSNSTRPHR